jgi:hypothetical protein
MADIEFVDADSARRSFDYAVREVRLDAPKPRKLSGRERAEIARALADYFALSGWVVCHRPSASFSASGKLEDKPCDPA